MSILILFQSFKVSDEIFNNKKDQKKGYIILEQEDDDDEVTVADDKSDVKEEKIDFESLLDARPDVYIVFATNGMVDTEAIRHKLNPVGIHVLLSLIHI